MAAVIQLVPCESAASQLSFIQTVSYPARQFRQLRQLQSASQSDSCLQVVSQSAISQCKASQSAVNLTVTCQSLGQTAVTECQSVIFSISRPVSQSMRLKEQLL